MLIGPELPPKKATTLAAAYALCLVSSILTGLILLSELIAGTAGLSILPVCGIIALSILCSMYITRTGRTVFPSVVLTLYILFLCVYYLFSGRVEEDMLFYYFLVPPLLVFCLPPRQSLVFCSVFITLLFIAFLPPVHARMPVYFPGDFRVRFLVALSCIFAVSMLAECVMARLLDSIYTLNSQFEQYSLTDPLTGLGNRRNCIHQFQRLHAIQLRSGNPFSILMIDMDHFKAINDTYGHLLGDKVLRFVAETLVQGLRRQDSLFRWGGEEFIMLLPGADLEQAEVAAERLRVIIEQTPFEDGQTSIKLTASFGVYMVDSPQEMPEHLKKADALLYHAKATGRNRIASPRTVRLV